MKLKILTILMLILISCKAQDTNKKEPMKTFDIETFNKSKNHLNEYDFELEDGTTIRQRKDLDEYYETVQKRNSYFQVINRYYLSGKLRASVSDFPSNFFHGIYKEYDEQGNLSKKTDYDQGYDYTWDDLLKYLEKRKVDIKGRYTSINKEDGNWRFSYVEGIYIYDVIIDGKTGEIKQDAKNVFEEGS